MRIDRLRDKCILYPETGTIRRVELLYDSGLCTILFRDGTSSSFLHDWEAYHVAYYGLCFTSDGKTVFTVTVPAGCTALVRLPDGSERTQGPGTAVYSA